jgi:hypothetical protein
VGYEVNRGRIATFALEAHVVDHCNLRCAECCTLSPSLPERFVDPDALARDLANAARSLAPQVFKLTGGEPLLHPALVACLEAARASGIAPVVSMTTNGHLATRVPDAAWRHLDRLTVSLYPSAPLPDATLAWIRDRAAEHDVRVTFKPAGRFQVMTPPAPLDEDTARRVFTGCWLRHRCHSIWAGRFYTCTRPPHLGHAEVDGVELHGDDLTARLLAYLEREEPLASCRACLGGTGAWIPHTQLTARSARR